MKKDELCQLAGYNPLVSGKILDCILARKAFIEARGLKRPLTENELAWTHYKQFNVSSYSRLVVGKY